VVAACSTFGKVPLPETYQIQQATEALKSGAGERLNIHSACSETAQDGEALVECMKSYGYEFIPRGITYPADECWMLRETGRDGRLPQAFCFRKPRE